MFLMPNGILQQKVVYSESCHIPYVECHINEYSILNSKPNLNHPLIFATKPPDLPTNKKQLRPKV